MATTSPLQAAEISSPCMRLINALRGHLAENGIGASRRSVHLKRLAEAIAVETTVLPVAEQELGRLYLDRVQALDVRIDDPMRMVTRNAEMTRQLQSKLPRSRVGELA